MDEFEITAETVLKWTCRWATAGLLFWRCASERRSGTYLKEQISKKAKIK
jgi:hypothetical protein